MNSKLTLIDSKEIIEHKSIRKDIITDKIKILISEGKRAKEIAEELNISERTYYNYLRDIRKSYNETPKYDEAIVRVIEIQENLLNNAISVLSSSTTINEKIQSVYLVSKLLKDLKEVYSKFGFIPNKYSIEQKSIHSMEIWLSDRYKSIDEKIKDYLKY